MHHHFPNYLMFSQVLGAPRRINLSYCLFYPKTSQDIFHYILNGWRDTPRTAWLIPPFSINMLYMDGQSSPKRQNVTRISPFFLSSVLVYHFLRTQEKQTRQYISSIPSWKHCFDGFPIIPSGILTVCYSLEYMFNIHVYIIIYISTYNYIYIYISLYL